MNRTEYISGKPRPKPKWVIHLYYGVDGGTYCGLRISDVQYTSNLNKMTCSECDESYDMEHGN